MLSQLLGLANDLLKGEKPNLSPLSVMTLIAYVFAFIRFLISREQESLKNQSTPNGGSHVQPPSQP